MNGEFVTIKKIDGVLFMPVVCGNCGKQLALVAIDPTKKYQQPVITIDSHDCPRMKQMELPNGNH